jgi:hypothetical protein
MKKLKANLKKWGRSLLPPILVCAFISISAHAGTISDDENNIQSLDPSTSIVSVTDDIILKSEIYNIGVVSVALDRDLRSAPLRKGNVLSIDPDSLPIPAKVWITGATLIGLIWVRRKIFTNKDLK